IVLALKIRNLLSSRFDTGIRQLASRNYGTCSGHSWAIYSTAARLRPGCSLALAFSHILGRRIKAPAPSVLTAIPTVISSLIDGAIGRGIEVASSTGRFANGTEELGPGWRLTTVDRLVRPGIRV